MKKFVLVLLLISLVVLIAGCKKKVKAIDYDGIILIPALIELDIEDVPDDLTSLIVVYDEIKVIKVNVDTSDVNFDIAGDYSIEITVDYSDGVTKKFNSVLRLSYYENIGIPKIIGIRNHIVELGSDELNLMEGVAFDDDTGYVDSGFSGEVNYSREGYYEIEYYVEDDDGNYITESSFVLVGSSFDYYEKLVPKLVAMSSAEKGYIREYALLYSAARYLTNNVSSFERYIDNIGNFITPKNYENLLGRKLREDESDTILNYGNILRKVDKEVYQIIKGSPISSIEENHFENAYEIYRIASEDVYLTKGEYSLKVTDLNDFTLFENYEGEKLGTMQNSIKFYSEYSDIGFDEELIEVISDTSYTFDSNLLKINETPFPGRFLHVFCYEEAEIVCPKSKLLNLNSYIQEVLIYKEEFEYGEAYKDYQIHKDALIMYKDLLLIGEESDLELIENALEILFEAVELKNNELHYKLNNNVFDITEIESILERTLNMSEVTALNHFEKNYDRLFLTNHYITQFSLSGSISDEEFEMLLTAYELIAALPYTSRLYTTYETGLILEGWDIVDYEIELERELTTYEIDSLEYARNHSNITDNYYLLEKYKFSSIDINHISLLNSSNDLFNTYYPYFSDTSLNTINSIIPEDEYKTTAIVGFNTYRKYMFYEFFDDKFGFIFNESNEDMLDDFITIFLKGDFTLDMAKDIMLYGNISNVERENDVYFTEMEKSIIRIAYEWKNQELDYFYSKNYLNTINYVEYFECDNVCQNSFELTQDFTGLNYSDLVTNLNHFSAEETEELFGKTMTSAETNAYSIIQEHINTKRYFYNYFRQLGVQDNIDKDTFNQYKIFFDYIHQSDTPIFINSTNNIVEQMTRVNFPSREQIEAGELIENQDTFYINQNIFRLYYERALEFGLEIDLENYLIVYNLTQYKNIRLTQAYPLIVYPQNYILNTEETVAFSQVYDVFETVTVVRFDGDIFNSKYNELSIENTLIGMQVLKDFGMNLLNYLGDDSTEHLSPELRTYLNTLTINQRNSANAVIDISIKEHFRRKFNQEYAYLSETTTDAEDIYVRMYTEMEYANVEYFWDPYNLGILLGRFLEPEEEYFFSFVDQPYAGELKISVAKQLGILGDEKVKLLDLIPVFEEVSAVDMEILYDLVPQNIPKVYGLRILIDRNFNNIDINKISVLLNEDADEIVTIFKEITTSTEINSITPIEAEKLITRINNILPISSSSGSYDLNATLGAYSFGFEYGLISDNVEFVEILKASLMYREIENDYEDDIHYNAKNNLQLSLYYVLTRSPGEFINYSITWFEEIKTVEDIETLLNRELTEFEKYLVKNHTEFVINRNLKYKAITYNSLTPLNLPLRERAKIFELQDLYLISRGEMVDLALNPNQYGVTLTQEQVEIILLLFG